MKFAEMKNLTLDEKARLTKNVSGRKEAATKASKQWRESTPELGKLYCALEVELTQGQRTISEDGKALIPRYNVGMGIGEFVEFITKSKPIPRGLQCKNAFSAFVGCDGKGLVSEDRYDKISSSCLEIAGQIVKEIGFITTRPEFAQVAEELNDYGKDTKENLRKILQALVPPDAMEASDADKLAEKLDTDGNIGTVVAALVRRVPRTVAEVLANHVPNLTSVQAPHVYIAASKSLGTFRDCLTKNDQGQDGKRQRLSARKWPLNASGLSKHASYKTASVTTRNACRLRRIRVTKSPR